MRPLIGVTANLELGERQVRLSQDYIQGVEHAGGLPYVVPPFDSYDVLDDVLTYIDGLLLTGGVDIDPQLFGQTPVWQMGTINPERDRAELYLTKKALDRGLPVFGICRGVQVLAVAAGGTLFQDLRSEKPSSLKHTQDAPRSYATHPVTVAAGSQVAAMLGSVAVEVNTFHHQAVRDVPPGFVVSAVAPDGVIEAIEDERTVQGGPFAVGVQWHPEGLWRVMPEHARLFQGFVEAAAAYRSLKGR